MSCKIVGRDEFDRISSLPCFNRLQRGAGLVGTQLYLLYEEDQVKITEEEYDENRRHTPWIYISKDDWKQFTYFVILLVLLVILNLALGGGVYDAF